MPTEAFSRLAVVFGGILFDGSERDCYLPATNSRTYKTETAPEMLEQQVTKAVTTVCQANLVSVLAHTRESVPWTLPAAWANYDTQSLHLHTTTFQPGR